MPIENIPHPNPNSLHAAEDTWREAYERMFEAASDDEAYAATKLTTDNHNPKVISAYLEENANNLMPETIFFLQVSKAIKEHNYKRD
jgi:hypothetical protein